MVTRETHRFVIREDEKELDALWIKKGLVRPTDIDCTQMSSEEVGELYQAKLDARTEFAAGDRVIYTRLERPRNTEWLATYVRTQETAGRTMHVISLDDNRKPRQVGWNSIRRA